MALAEQYVEKEHYTEAEYFEIERTSFGRWEYVDGKIRQMSGGTTDHGDISSNLVRVLGNSLVPRGCHVYGSDVKIHTGNGINTFPDISVICGQNHYYLGKKDIVLNPVLIVEVLSPSTESYDRGEKFGHYRTIETLTDYLLVEQDQAQVMLYTRRTDYWEMRVVTGLDSSVFLPSVDVTLSLTDVYALIDFDAE
jgi:Uma2 family endonuclease